MNNLVKAYHVKWDCGDVSIMLASSKADLFSHIDSLGSIDQCEVRIMKNFPTLWDSKDGINFTNDADECSDIEGKLLLRPPRLHGADLFGERKLGVRINL